MKFLCRMCLVLTLFISVPLLTKAAPYVNDTGVVVDDSLPKGFTFGYSYGDFEKYNSPAEVNGLGGTYIWIEGSYDSLMKIETGTEAGNITGTILTDIYGNQWSIALDLEQIVPDSVFEKLYGKQLAIGGRYEGFSNKYQMPSVFCTKICDITTGEAFNCVLTSNTYDDIPDYFASLSGRYYYTEDLEKYRPHIYYDIAVSAGFLTYTNTLATITSTPETLTRNERTDNNGFFRYRNILNGMVMDVNGNLLIVYPNGTKNDSLVYVRADNITRN